MRIYRHCVCVIRHKQQFLQFDFFPIAKIRDQPAESRYNEAAAVAGGGESIIGNPLSKLFQDYAEK